MIAGLGSVPQVVHASPPSHPDERPSLDGVGTCLHRASPPCSWQLLTTTKKEDVIILVAYCNCPSDTPSIIDSAGLNYVMRVAYTISLPLALGPGFLTLREFYATAESPLTSDNITAPSTLGLQPIQAFAIHTSDIETIFDPNPSLPVTLTCPWTNSPDLVVFHDCSASAGPLSDDFVIAITAINDAPSCPAIPSSGFSELVFDGSTLDIQYRIVGRSQSTVTFTCAGGEVSPNTDPMAMVLDAISLSGNHGVEHGDHGDFGFVTDDSADHGGFGLDGHTA